MRSLLFIIVVLAQGLLVSGCAENASEVSADAVDMERKDHPSSLPSSVKPKPSGGSSVPLLEYSIVEEFPHNTDDFTQGLVLQAGILFEGTGLYGESLIRSTEFKTKTPLNVHRLPKTLFGEGITVFDGRLYQLTWKSGSAFVYDAHDFSLLDSLNYEGEGWGLTHNGKALIMSDGSSTISFRDPESFSVQRRVEVTLEGKPVKWLNELEFIEGYLFANQWQTADILMIEPETGQVLAILRLSEIVDKIQIRDPRSEFLNGIAYDWVDETFLITGKWWPTLYKLKVVLPSEK